MKSRGYLEPKAYHLEGAGCQALTWIKKIIIIITPREPKARAELSSVNSSEKKTKTKKVYIYIYIYFVGLPSNSEKQSMNDVRQREGC